MRQLIWDNFDLTPHKTENKTATAGDKEEEAVQPPGSASNTNENPDTAQSVSNPPLASSRQQNDPASGQTSGVVLPSPSGTQIGTQLNYPDGRVWPIQDAENLWFSIMNMDVEGYYCEIKPPENRPNDSIEEMIHEKIFASLEKYNEQPDKPRISLVLYKEFN